MIGAGLVPLAKVTLWGIEHPLDPSGSWCTTCNENADRLVEQGGEGSF